MAPDATIIAARDIVRRLRYFEFLDNVVYYDRFAGGCPSAGASYEDEANAFLVGLSDDLLKSPETARVVDALRERAPEDFASELDRGVARWLTRRYDEASKVPGELLAELSRANAEGQRVWAECRANDDFKGFLPALERQFDLQRRIADAIDPDARAYDVIVSRCDPSYTTEQLDAVFDRVKAGIRDILASSSEAWAKVDASVLDAADAIDEAALDRLVALVPQLLGADPERITRWNIRHPVTCCTGPRDGRPSTYLPGTVTTFQALRAMAHETGHAMYGYSSSDEVVEASLWGGIEGFMHESQSRFYENHVFRTPEFWAQMLPRLAAECPAYEGVAPEQVVRAINKPNPCVSRLAADELTYPLHIIIRHEIERDYFDGKLALADIEDAWNAKYESYLGVRPAGAGEGVLSDVHWASGCVGYFFSYALGDLYAAQFDHALRASVPDAYAKLAAGDPSAVRDCLATHVWASGQAYSAPETLERATGEPLKVDYYVDYLRGRFEI